VVLVGLAACGRADPDPEVAFETEATIRFDAGAEPVALAARRDGSVLVGERRTGRIREITRDGELLPEPVAQVAVTSSASDQRGLLGVAVDGERIYAAWTRAGDGRIVVAELTGEDQRPIWEGPVSSDRANGGHLAVLGDGRLLVGIGDLEQPDQLREPDAPHGKLLVLDPSRDAGRRPTALSSGWNNPFAFVVATDGEVWVADNAPGESPERIGRGDTDGERFELPGRRAPAALVELEPGTLGLCGYLDETLTVVDVTGERPDLRDDTGTPCRTGAVTLADGRLAVSDGERVRILLRR
jgi:hypothetical protein